MELSQLLTQSVILFGIFSLFLWIFTLLDKKINSRNSNLTQNNFLNSTLSVDILVPAYNEEEGIIKTLRSVQRLVHKGKINCYIINDASIDSTAQNITSFLDNYNKNPKQNLKYILIDKTKNEGKAKALNDAIAQSTSPFIAVIDADSQVSRRSLLNSMKLFDNTNEVGAVISRMKPSNRYNNWLERVQFIEYVVGGFVRSLFAYQGLLHHTPGVLSIYRREAIEYFDSQNITEDFEAGLRVRKNGYKVEYCEDSEVYTTTPNTFSSYLKQRVRWTRGYIQTHGKHREIFFNKKYGWFGLYQLPMNVIYPALLLLTVLSISINILNSLHKFTFQLVNAFGTIELFSLSFDQILLSIDYFIVIPSLISISLSLTLILLARKFYKENFFRKQPLKYCIAFIIYFLLYGYIYIYSLTIALFKNITKQSYNWGRTLKND